MYTLFSPHSRQCAQILTLLISMLCLSACASHPGVGHRKSLDVHTKMSTVIFLDPVPASQQSVFLQIKNTSDYTVSDLEASIRKALEKKGYQIVEKPEQAHYLLQAQIVQMGVWDRQQAEQARMQGFGTALGDATSALSLDACKEKVYSLLSDLQISERVGKTVEVKQKTPPKRAQRTPVAQAVVETETVHWKRYQSRVLSTADPISLKTDKAVRALVAGLIRTLTGIF